MTAQPINSARASGVTNSASASAIPKTTTKAFNDLSSEDFFGLLIAQLQSQDPLKPTDNQTLMTQMSTIRQMESSSQLNKTLQNLSAEQRFGSTSALIGHYVVGSLNDSGGNPVTVQGVVTGVHFDSDGSAILELHNGVNLPTSKVTEVTLVENLPQEIQQQLVGQGAPTGAKDKYGRLIAGAQAKSPVPANGGSLGSVISSAAKDGGVAHLLSSLLGGEADAAGAV